MRSAVPTLAALALAACASPDRLTTPAARPSLAVTPSMTLYQFPVGKLVVGSCTEPTRLVRVDLQGSVQLVLRSVAVGGRLNASAHTNYQGVRGTLPDGTGLVAVGTTNGVENVFDTGVDPNDPLPRTAQFSQALSLVRPGSGVVYGARFHYKITVTPGGATTASFDVSDAPGCL